MPMKRPRVLLPILIAAACVLSACTQPNSTIYTGTATIIGVDVSQSASQVPQGTLGYKRAELGIIPTDLGQCYLEEKDEKKELHCPPNISAKNSPDVLMELYYPGIFTNGGIYQRLAVGTDAVKQPGAAALFVKAPDGSISPNAAAVISQATIAGQQEAKKVLSDAKIVSDCVNSSGTFDKTKLDKIADATGSELHPSVVALFKGATTPAQLDKYLIDSGEASHAMAAAINGNGSLCQ
jgi:hypothetical protein